MSKLRFLIGVYIPALGKMYNINDILETDNKEIIKNLKEYNYVDEIFEEEDTKPKPKTKKKMEKSESDEDDK